tara:strand:- start:83209 stop:83643 length:435 start_codon:yes stop_codon:yes gene_type:complete
MCGQPSLPSLASRLVRPVHVLTTAALCMCMSGCGGTGSLSVTGFVSLDGRPTPAEILIEQLDRDGNQAGRSVTAYADEQGEFSVSIDPASGGAKLLDCRFVVRVSQLSSSGLPAAFDENALPEKKIRLRRVLRDNDSLHILLTQ